MKNLLLLTLSVIAFQVQATYYYVDPDLGSDDNSGTSSSPWQTVKFALGPDSPLEGGDVLQLKSGIYKEESIRIHVQSLNKQFIKVRGSSGVIFEGTDQILSERESWTLIDPVKRIYVYNEPVEQVGKLNKFFFRGFFDYKGERNSLIAYKDEVNFNSEYEAGRWPDPETAPADSTIGVRYYAGPGTYYDPILQKLYLRMQMPSPNIVPAERTLAQLSEDDLSEITLHIAKPQTTNLFGFDIYGDAYLRFENLNFFNFQLPIFNIAHKSHELINHVKFHNCKFENNSMCIISSHVSNILVQQCKFEQHIPDYISFNDGKGGTYYMDDTTRVLSTNPASRLTGDALAFGNKSSEITVRYCTFEDMWDCVQFTNGAKDSTTNKFPFFSKVYNCTFKEVMDDAVEINNDAMEIEVFQNQFLEVTFGLTISGQRDTQYENDNYQKGRIFYHHNIVDAVPKFGGRANRNHESYRYTMNTPFMGSHNVGNETKCAVKIYQNTLRMRNGYKNRWIDPKNKRYLPNLVGSDATAQVAIENEAEIPEKAMEVYNNIFIHENFNFMLDNKMRLHTGKELFNGNVYHRTLPDESVPYMAIEEKPIWRAKFPSLTLGDEIVKDYWSLEEFQADETFYNQTEFLGNHFEQDGQILESLDLTPSFRIYSDSPAATGAIDLTGKGWPGVDASEGFRGAKAPLSASSREYTTKETEYQNDKIFPNPFKEQLQIVVDQTTEGPINIQLFNLQGQLISTLFKNSNPEVGVKTIEWNAAETPAGTYFIRIDKADITKTIKVIKSE